MKKISKDKLDAKLYLDRKNSVTAKSKEGNDLTIRDQLKILIDTSYANQKINRESIKRIDAVYEALSGEDDVILENADFDFMVDHFEKLGITPVHVYKTYINLFDSAEAFKAS